MAVSYILDRMLGEFAVAAAVLSKGVEASGGERGGDGEVEDGVSCSKFTGLVERILQESHPTVFSYYSRCLDRGHKHFLWTGPTIQILPRSEDIAAIIPITTKGEMLDHPGHLIYPIDVDQPAPASPPIVRLIGKRPISGDVENVADERPKKRKREP